ncbi:MAG: hypothetical protein ACRDHZ_05645 [Ktedonobacteraceae bacterium]
MQQMRVRSNLHWIMIAAICISTCIFLTGMANVTSTSNSPGPQVAKAHMLQQLLSAGNPSSGAKTDNPNPALIVQTAPIRQAGIMLMHQGPFLSSTFTVNNFWQGPVDDAWVLAYSGAKLTSHGEDTRGGMVLYTEKTNTQGGFNLYLLGTFLAPNGTTALTITAVNAHLLQLSSENGANLTFDLTTHQFS